MWMLHCADDGDDDEYDDVDDDDPARKDGKEMSDDERLDGRWPLCKQPNMK